MNSKHRIQYLANVIYVAYADDNFLPLEQKAIELIKSEVGATEQEFQEAREITQKMGFTITPVGCYSEQIKNVEDMLFVGMVDKQIDPKEQKPILDIAKTIKINQDQINIIISNTKTRTSDFLKTVNNEKRDDESGYDIRKIRWGMDINQVKASEKAVLKNEQEDLLVYEDTVMHLKCDILYTFEKNLLIKAHYSFTGRHTNNNQYLNEYNLLEENLTKKYGKASDVYVNWNNNLYRDDFNSWGDAVSMGHLVYLTTWETSRIKILHSLLGDNYEISHGISYESRLHDDIIGKAHTNKILGEL